MPRYLTSALLLGCVWGASWSSDVAVRLTVPDVQGTAQRLMSGPLGAAWREPALADWWHGLLPQAQAERWLQVPGQAQHLRIEARIGPERGGLPAVACEVAALAPQLPAPEGPIEAFPHRAGAWLVAGLGPGFADPPTSVLPEGMGDADAGISLHLPAWCHLMPPPADRLAAALCGKLGLADLDVRVHADGAGLREQAIMLGAHLPVRPLEPGALAGMPEHPMALLALSLDGPAMTLLIKDLLGQEQEIGEAVVAATGQTLEALAGSCDGCIAIALVPGTAGPDWVLSLPRRPAFDALIAGRIAVQAPDAVDAVLAASDVQPVAVEWPGLGKPMLRRTHGRWLLGTAFAELAAVAAEDQPYPLGTLCPDAGERSVAVAYADFAQCLPQLAARVSAERQGLARAIAAAGAHVPPLSLAVDQNDGGLNVSGRNGLGLLVPLCAMLPTVFPRLALEYAQEAQEVAQKRMAALITRAKSFADATSGHWPRDFDDLRAWARELDEDALAMAGRPDLKQPFCYVPPQVGAPNDQPVLVQDPSCNHDRGSLVGFVSGQVRFIPGNLYWREAKRLSALPEARAEGIDFNAWATAPKTF